MDTAQIYMTLLRPSMIPVVGESADDLFKGQIELNGWSWNFHNDKEKKNADDAAEVYTTRESELTEQSANTREIWAAKKALKKFESSSAIDDINDSIAELADEKDPVKRAARKKDLETSLTSTQQSNDAAMRAFKAEMNKALAGAEKSQVAREHDQHSKDREKQKKELEYKLKELQRNKNFEFNFSKRIDIATTQMLNSMKAGDVFPTAILTMHQASSNSGLSLVITATKMRLLDYALKVEVSDTMTDMKEEWVAEFASVGYVYKNRKSIAKASGAGQAVAQAASQGTVRTFVMKNLLPF